MLLFLSRIRISKQAELRILDPGRGEGVFPYERREGGSGVLVPVEIGISAGETGIPAKIEMAYRGIRC